MKLSKFLKNTAIIALFSVILSPLSGFSAPIVFSLLFGAGMVNHQMTQQNGPVFFDGLAPEVWLPLVKENFYPNASFLNGAQDMSSLVNYDAINFAEAGADPAVLKNNTTYPVNSADAGDTPKQIVLDYYDTESTIVRNAVAIELAYDQRVIYANKHKKALMKRFGRDAAYAYAPVQTDVPTNNKVISLASGDSVIDAIIDLQAFYNNTDVDGTERHLVLHGDHMAAIAKEDKVLYKSLMVESGTTYCGFKIWTYSQNPLYVTSTGVKAAFGVAYNSSIHKKSSFAFLGNEVMKAQGTIELFSKLKDPDIKGDKFNFQMRGLVGSLRGQFGGAILK